jgi:hypothetical protein
MLTPTDIHYLVGCLVQSEDGADIEVELGDMVYDDAANKTRDVDITITRKNNDGLLEAYHGLEVKDHLNPLDVIHVEQLCTKMADMPSLTSKSIVSSSGYTKPAKLKAKKHGVELLELIDWDDTTKGFDFFTTARENYRFVNNKFTWLHAELKFFFDTLDQDTVTTHLDTNPPIFDIDGNSFPTIKCFQDFPKILPDQVKNTWRYTEEGKALSVNETKQLVLNVEFDKMPYFFANNQKVAIDKVLIYGTIQRTHVEGSVEFKLLRKVDEITPLAGCAVFLSGNGHLTGISMSNIDKKSRILYVPFTDRIKGKIYKKGFIKDKYPNKPWT